MALMDEVLIEAVEKHRILYDKEQTLFRDIAAKDSAWATISGETGASAKRCKERWRTIRDRFVKEKRKMNSSNHYPPGVSTWRLMPALQFLHKHIDLPRQRSFHTADIADIKAAIKSEYTDAESSNIEPEQSVEQDKHDANSQSEDPLFSTPVPSSPPRKRIRPKGARPSSSQRPSSSRVLIKLLDSINQQQQGTNAADAFGSLVAAEMKNLPSGVQRKLRSDILELINKAHEDVLYGRMD